ncbi:MAG: hypothetical protein EBT88_17775, partial [Proteobacteria bacterium]|nr:hypothetical protein [Pseudomonadota bacterium]
SKNGVNFHGEAAFKFAIRDHQGSVLWKSGKEEGEVLRIFVTNGRYTVLLGGQGTNALSPEIFASDQTLYLHVRVDLGDKKGWREISPDQPIHSTPHSLASDYAKIAGGVSPGSITSKMLSDKVKTEINKPIAPGAITTAQLNEQILKYLKPEITLSPQAPGLIFNGQTITLHSRAEGKYLTYQWYKNGQAIAGADKKRFVIEDVNKSRHDGNYTLVVSNDFGSVTTQPTQLVVDGTPTSHTVPSISMDMIFCPPGTFIMGSPTTEAGRGEDETQHQVTLTNGFYLGKYEVTQAQYETVMTGNSEGLNAKPSQWPNNNDRPVEKVSWNDVQVFLSRLNDME